MTGGCFGLGPEVLRVLEDDFFPRWNPVVGPQKGNFLPFLQGERGHFRCIGVVVFKDSERQFRGIQYIK